MWFPWAQALVSAFFAGVGVVQLVLGHALAWGGIYTRRDWPYTFWFLTGTCFVIAAIFVVSGVKDYLEESSEDADAPPNNRWRGP